MEFTISETDDVLVSHTGLALAGALEKDGHLPPMEKMPLSKPVARRRLRSVIQDLMYLAARLTRHARRWSLGLWSENPWRYVWQRLYHRFTRPPTLPLGRSP